MPGSGGDRRGATLGPGHPDPGRAVTATARIRPATVVPIHWGTYAAEDGRRTLPRWFDRACEEFAATLAAADLGNRLRLLEPEEDLSLP